MTVAVCTPDEMVVCSRVRWLADDMAAGAAGRWPVRHDYGFGLPSLESGLTRAWWSPAGHAARLLAGGMEMHLCAPGPTWLADIPEVLTGRPVWAGTLDELSRGRGPRFGFAKPAEAKIDALAAAWYDNIGDFAAAANSARLPGGSWVQVSPVRLDLVEEHRCFVHAGEVVAASPYLLADGTTWEPGMETWERLHHDGARRFAADAVAELTGRQPAAYALDVGLLASGRWVVVEANPAWCAGTYGAELTAVVDVVVASSLTVPGETDSHGAWAWRPDPALVADAERAPLR